MRPSAGLLPVIVSALALSAIKSSVRQDVATPIETERTVVQAFERGEYERALRLIETHLKDHPEDAAMLYNAACACCYLDQPDEAAQYLFEAVKAGFRDFDHMQSDPDLELIRDHPIYLAIVEAQDRVKARSDANRLQEWKEKYGEENYRYERDEKRRLAYATALDEQSHKQMREMLEAEADHLIATLFGKPPEDEVFIAIPTSEDSRRIFKDDSIAGVYSHSTRQLIAADTGPSLRHEFFHLMHYGHMQRLKQNHPLWIEEGMAALYEAYELKNDDTIVFLPNARHNIAKRNAKMNLHLDWEKLIELDDQRFLKRAGKLYPQTRSMFEYVAEKGKLIEWYKTYVGHFETDETGRLAFERVFDKPLEQIEQDWRKWIAARPFVDLEVRPGDATLNIVIENSNHGAKITAVQRTRGVRNPLHRGDVIVAINGRPIRTASEVVQRISDFEPGEVVKVRVRRYKVYKTLNVRLQRMGGGFFGRRR